MRRPSLLIVGFVLCLVAAACGGGDGGGQSGGSEGATAGGSITFWSTENQPDRVALTKDLIERFTEESGIDVELVPVAEDELPSLMISNAASGDLPDVVYHPLDFAAGWAEQGLLDPDAANEVIDELGRDTFTPAALELGTVEDEVVSIPSDGWGQLIVYRKDLFSEAGLEPPDSFEALEAAAQALHNPGENMSGITLSTDPADVFTQQTFEQLALANGCELVDDGGAVTLNSPQCVGAIDFYQRLVNDYSPGSAQNVDSTRATYFAGQAAMIIWSPFILDEMAGLRNDALPTCPECEDDPAFLAENSGLVTALSGGGAEPAQYGSISFFGIGADSNVEAAKAFARYWFTDGYIDWLRLAPEGKFPMRSGTAEAPDEYVSQWE
ncbi:MAG: extracellular solute-binding protein, partial [Actinomycetota bacterium]|nr:extracellular solute-binding protein [Actinomycetota bacterium]